MSAAERSSAAHKRVSAVAAGVMTYDRHGGWYLAVALICLIGLVLDLVTGLLGGLGGIGL